ncbi:MAG: hypothetical protein HDR32_00050 [Treponema sp.]|nr:hypothetical protein [Treponema sp.]
MATTANILTLLKFFAGKQGDGIVAYGDFVEYLKRYAEHHLDEQPALAAYVSDPVPPLQAELAKLAEKRQVTVIDTAPGKQGIVIVPFYIDRFADRYKDLLANPGQPFPSPSDLPKSVPQEIISRQDATNLLYALLDQPETSDKSLYALTLPNDMPPILLPSSVPAPLLIAASLAKLRLLLSKGDHHDYFLKKMTISNPGREMTAKNFFNKFADQPDSGMELLQESGELFYLWNQLCYFIRQDYEKIKEYTSDDISRLQAITIVELAANYYKTKAHEDDQKAAAFAALKEQMQRPPYAFTVDAIIKFCDAKGAPLLSSYSEEELKSWIQSKSTQSGGDDLPDLLIFKTADNERYFIFKNKVMPLIVRLCADARVTVRDSISKHWDAVMRNYQTLPEMKNQDDFERRVEREVQEQVPLLYALLHASFLPLIASERGDETEQRVMLYENGNLVPYSELLLMNRAELYTGTRLLLPFWYTMPLVSWLAKLFSGSSKKSTAKHKNSAEQYRESEAEKRRQDAADAEIAKNPNVSKKIALREAARDAEQDLVPRSSTLDRELESYCRQWNHLIGKESNANLTEDVNTLIRDYVRKTLRSFKSTSLTVDRIKNMAETIVSARGLQKIKNRDALFMYTQLYIVKLIKNLPT